MSVWAITVGHLTRILPTTSIIVGHFLGVLGGECVLQSTIFVMTSALASDYVQRYVIQNISPPWYVTLMNYRASYFSYISSTSYVVSFLGPTLASTTMSWNIWLPFWTNIGLLACAVPTIMMLPSATDSRLISSTAALNGQFQPHDVEEIGPLLADSEGGAVHHAIAFEKPHGMARECMQAAKKLVNLIRGRRNFQVLLCSFFLTALASSDTKLLVQYISKRYEWTFAQVSYKCAHYGSNCH